MKRYLRYFIWVFTACLIAFILVPFIFQEKFIEAIKEQIETYVDADVEFESGKISLISSFPAISVSLQNVRIDGINDFNEINLIRSDQFSFTTDWKSLLRSNKGIEISALHLENTSLNIHILKDGTPNYRILKSTQEEESKVLFGEIKKYVFENAQIRYKDLSSGLQMEFKDIYHEGSGEFNNVKFDLNTTTSIEEATITYDGINYLNNVHLAGDVKMGIDLDKNLYLLKENFIKLNELDFSIVGFIQILKNAYELDLSIDAPNNSVSSLLSMVPYVYKEQYDQIQSTGNGSLSAIVKGRLDNNKNLKPAINILLGLDNGSVQYSDSKYQIERINLRAELSAKESSWSDMVVDIPSFVIMINEEQLMGRLSISDIYGNTNYQGTLIGELDLEKFNDAIRLNAIDQFAGVMKSDISFSTDKMSILNNSYEKMNMEGQMELNNLRIDFTDENKFSLEKLEASMSPETIHSKYSNAIYNTTDFTGELKLNNPFYLLTDEQKPKLIIRGKSKQVNLNALKYSKSDPDTSKEQKFSIPFDVELDYQIDKLQHSEYRISDIELKASYEDSIFYHNASLRLFNSESKSRGEIKNFGQYLKNKGQLEGDIFFESENLDLNRFKSTRTSSSQESMITIPDNINLKIYYDIDRLKYGDYSLTSVDGKLTIDQGTATLQEGTARLFNGNIALEGNYNTKDPKNPLFDFRYNMSNIDFSQMFLSSETFKALAPIAEYINGIFNSTLVMSGPLKSNMIPDLYSLSASGYLETVKGKINGFRPLEVMGADFGLEQLENWNIKDSKNWFEITNGVIYLKEHDYRIEDMEFKVAGHHSLSQEIDYTIKAIIPREKLKEGQIGEEFNSSLDRIDEMAKARGLDISLGENIYFTIKLTGTIASPRITITPTGSGGKSIDELVQEEIKNKIEETKDSVSVIIETKKDEILDTISQRIEEKIDTLEVIVEEKIDSLKASAEDKIKDVIKDEIESKLDSSNQVKLDSLKAATEDKIKDVFGDSAQKDIDSIKSRLKDWNPFKKKKNDSKNK